MTKSRSKSKLTVTLQFDLEEHPDSFGKFIKALIDGGFESEIRELAKMMQEECLRRGIPFAKEIRDGK